MLMFRSWVSVMPDMIMSNLSVSRAGMMPSQAVLTSCQAVLVNPTTLALWAAMIMAITGLGLATMLIGLVFAIPVLGHASWHAYRDLVDTSSLVERLPPKEAS